MKTILLRDSDEEAIVEFVTQHEQLFDKTKESFKDKQKKEKLWKEVTATRNLPVKTVKKWLPDIAGPLTQSQAKELRREF